MVSSETAAGDTSREVSPPPLKRLRTVKSAPPSRSDSTVDLYSWNINGISPFVQRPITSFFKSSNFEQGNQGSPHASLRHFLTDHDFPALLFLQEVKINPDDQVTQRAVERAVRRQSGEPVSNPDYVVHFSLPKDRFNATGFGRKVYGVCSIVRADFSEQFVKRVREVDWDSEGRFSVIETKASGDLPTLAFFNVYLVNGTDNAYKDSNTGEVVGTRHDRKLQVHRHLEAECRALTAGGFEIVIAGDCNIARSQLDGHPNYPRGRLFGSSCDRVDMIICTRTVAARCVEARIFATAGDRGPSDHVPICAAFDFSEKHHP